MNIRPTFEFEGIRYEVRDLPERIDRWTVYWKRFILAAFDAGILSEKEAEERYYLSREELEIWRWRLQRQGRTGLRASLQPAR